MKWGSQAYVVLVFSMLSCSACGKFQGGSTTSPQGTLVLPSDDILARVPLGQVAGATARRAPSLTIANPYQDNPQAIQQGKELFIKMNCAGCHAYNGKGNMGPDLTDTYWRYGGLPVQIYLSIRDGRSNGMAAWGVALPSSDLWKLVAFVQSLGGSVAAPDDRYAGPGDMSGEQASPNAEGNALEDSRQPIATQPTITPATPLPVSPRRETQP